MILLQVFEKLRLGELDSAKTMVTSLEDPIDKKLAEAAFASYRGNYSDAYERNKEIYQKSCNRPIRKSFALNGMIWANIRLGNYALASNLTDELSNVLQDTHFNNNLLDLSFQADLFNARASIMLEVGKLTKAIEYYETCLDITIEIGDEIRIASIKNNLAYAQLQRGELRIAYDLFADSLSVYKKKAMDIQISRVKSNMAEIYRIKGDYHKALGCHQEVLEIRKLHKRGYDLALSYYYVGQSYVDLGNFDKAIPLFEKSITYWTEIGNLQWLSKTILALGKTLLQKDKKVFDQIHTLEVFYEKTGNSLIEQRFLLLKALQLKSLPRMASIAKAQELLEIIIDRDTNEFEVMFDALLHSCDILFKELRITNEQVIYDEAQLLLRRLEHIAKDNRAYGKMIDILFLKAKMAIIDLRYGAAQKILAQAEILADEKDMKNYLAPIDLVKNNLHEDMKKLGEIIHNNHNVIERARLLKLTDYLSEVHNVRKSITSED